MPWARSCGAGIWIGLRWAALISLIASCAVWRWKTVWARVHLQSGCCPPVSVMIGTFITLYTGVGVEWNVSRSCYIGGWFSMLMDSLLFREIGRPHDTASY
jgi:hypothetical protein